MNINRSKLSDNQGGFASLVIAIVIVLVLSLMTVGFAQLMRTEQRSALDKQLSSQAYYAAESGVNDAIKAINAGYSIAKTKCGNTPGVGLAAEIDSSVTGYTYLEDNTVGATSGATTAASYPCLLINPGPINLDYGSVGTYTPTTAEFTARDSLGQPSTITSIEISWEDASSNSNNTYLPPAGGVCGGRSFETAGSGGWSYTGLVNFQLTPVPDNHIKRADLLNSSMTAFLCPNSGNGITTGSLTYDNTTTGVNSGVLARGNCNTNQDVSHTYNCTATITGLGALSNQTTYFISLRSIYAESKVNIKAFNGATKLSLTGAQSVIDSTGKAQDVLRRIQVRVPAGNTYDLPPGTSGGLICKQLEAEPTSVPVNRCQP